MPGQNATRILLNAIHYSGAGALAANRLRGEGGILMLHRTGPREPAGFQPNNHLNIAPRFLARLLEGLADGGFDFVDLDNAVARIQTAAAGNPYKRPFVSVTLDDAYKDNLKFAVPLFRKFNVPYTIFVSPGLVDGRATLWWEDLEMLLASRDRIDLDMPGGRVEFPLNTPVQKNEAYEQILAHLTTWTSEQGQRRVMSGLCELHGIDAQAHRKASILNWKELAELAKDPLCTLGAHTVHHYAVARLNKSDAKFEIEESARLIELETGQKPAHFAFPYGYPAAAGERDFGLCKKAGFTSAVTTRHGVCYSEHAGHLHALPRISVNGNFQRLRYVKTLLSGVPTRLSNKGGKLNVA